MKNYSKSFLPAKPKFKPLRDIETLKFRPKIYKNSRLIKSANDVLIIALGSLIYSLGVHCFTAPNGIAPGGVVGIATIVTAFTGISTGLLYGIFNIPLIIIGLKFLGLKHMLKTVISVALITVSTDWLFLKIPVYEGDKILAGIFGGVFFGFGMGLIYLREATSGGVDIVNKIINKKRPHLKMGAVMLTSDAVVVSAAMLAFGSVESGLYAIIAIFACSKVVDLILYGSLEGKLLLIFSDKRAEIAQRILTEEKRGVTFLKAYGAYSGENKDVICCAVRKSQYAGIKRKVGEIDPAAFIVIADAGEVFGEGFAENV